MAPSAFLLVCFLIMIKAEYVPVLIVCSDGVRLPPVSTRPVHKISEREFMSDYLANLSGPLVVVEQDTFSMEDFAVYGGAYGRRNGSFPNLRDLLDKKSSLLLPAVHNPGISLRKLEEHWDVMNIDGSLVPNAITPKTLISIRLATDSDRSLSLKKNDEVVGKIVGQLPTPYCVLYTGRKSSWVIDQEERERIGRHILEVDDAISTRDGVVLFDQSNNNTLLFTRNVTYYMTKYLNDTMNTTVLLKNDFVVKGSPVENSTTISFEISSTPGEPELKSISISFEFQMSRGNWMMNNLNVSVENVNISKTFAMSTNDIWAPMSYSYNCKEPRLFRNDNQSECAIALYFNTLQIQSFMNDTVLHFGYPFDCVGFFTIPILTSIFITLILVLILAFAVQQMTSIHTMDRFDDPKGKTISVPAAE